LDFISFFLVFQTRIKDNNADFCVKLVNRAGDVLHEKDVTFVLGKRSSKAKMIVGAIPFYNDTAKFILYRNSKNRA